MRYIIQLALVLTVSLILSCGGDVPSSTSQTEPTPADTSATSPGTNASDTTARASHDCTLAGKILDGNQTWLDQQELLITVLADESTNDPDYGEGHRILVVTDTKTCEEVQREILPVSSSPDFPYYIAEIVYNNTSQLVGIRGADVIYCYDVLNRELLAPLSPGFLNKRSTDDAQSGMIQRLEVWEDYLIGYAQDMGTFVFDLTNKDNPKALLPYAEFKTKTGDFHSMFMVPSADAGLQAIIPQYDYDADEFKVNPLFQAGKALNTNIPKSAKNNRFLVLREQGESGKAVGIDLQTCKEITLPEDTATKKVQEVLTWLRANAS
ncbi:MAG: hypothetical protein KTR30_29035 [Saprospiraceae bacterium]|nr:hypothetical protein [Saprospiraceae bacterium]